MVKFELPKLPYAYDALEPHIDAKTMEIHHTKHHQAYTDKLNAALEKGGIEAESVEDLLADLSKVPEEVRGAVNFNGGGYVNHEIFWNNMKQGGGGDPAGKVADMINESFGSFAEFKELFSSKTAVIQGSGWGWLVFNPSSKKVEFVTMSNQDSPITKGLVPLLGLDVWEHAYYLKYQNKRPAYIEAWWNVINWEDVNSRLGNI